MIRRGCNDSQSVKTTENGGVRGYDAGKKITGRKRHALVDTDGRALKLHVHAASVQDRDGAGPLLRVSRPRWHFVQIVFPDAGYQGPRVATSSPIRVEIVRRIDGQISFAVIATPLDGGALPRLDQSKPLAGKGLRKDDRLRRSLPLRGFIYAASTKARSLRYRFQTPCLVARAFARFWGTDIARGD